MYGEKRTNGKEQDRPTKQLGVKSKYRMAFQCENQLISSAISFTYVNCLRMVPTLSKFFSKTDRQMDGDGWTGGGGGHEEEGEGAVIAVVKQQQLKNRKTEKLKRN